MANLIADVCVEIICNAFKEALEQMKMGSVNEIERLKEFLISSNLCPQDNFQTLYKNVCLPLLKTIDKKIDDDPKALWVLNLL